MPSAPFIDLYEILQISPNADGDTIYRVYRMLAQRFHPDNLDTGNADEFRRISDAYHELADPELRAAFDVKHREAKKVTWKVFDQSNVTQGFDAERRKRQGILSLLYRKRISDPHEAFLIAKDFEDLLGTPREHLEFALWYLKEGGFLQRTDNGRYTITLQGVKLAEEMHQATAAA